MGLDRGGFGKGDVQLVFFGKVADLFRLCLAHLVALGQQDVMDGLEVVVESVVSLAVIDIPRLEQFGIPQEEEKLLVLLTGYLAHCGERVLAQLVEK